MKFHPPKKILHILNTVKNNILYIAVKLEMNMTEEKIKESFGNIQHLMDEKESNEKEEYDNVTKEQNNDTRSESAENFEEDFEEDFEDLQNDILIFKNEMELNLRDYTDNCTENDKGLFLYVNINGKKYIMKNMLRKSSLYILIISK